jgi:hypothetical protein
MLLFSNTFDIRMSDLLTIQFRLSFKDKGHKSLEYYCLVIHLTSVISTISYPESNGDIFIVIAPWGNNRGITNTRTNVVRVICQQYINTYCERFINNTIWPILLDFKGHKSLEYCCLVIHFTSVSTISYAESNGTCRFLVKIYKSSAAKHINLRFAKVAVSVRNSL